LYNQLKNLKKEEKILFTFYIKQKRILKELNIR
jgi:hypothetical protein